MTEPPRAGEGLVPGPLALAAAYSWRFLVVVAALAVVSFVLVTLRLIVIPAIVALLVTTVLAPPARLLMKRRLPPLLATWLVFGASLALLAGLVYVLVPQVADQLGGLGADVRRGTEDVVTWLVSGPLDLSRADIDRFLDELGSALQEQRGTLVSGAYRGAYLLIEIIAGIILSFVLTFFFVKDGSRIAAAILGFVPEERRDAARAIGEDSWAALTAYVRGVAVVGIVDALAIGIALFVLGVPLIVPLVVLTFLAAFFPMVGAIIAGAVATLVTLVTVGVVPALVILVVTIAVQQLDGDVLQPLVVGRAVRLHPLVVLLALTAGAVIGGIAGAFVAVPLAAVISVVVGYMREQRIIPRPR